MLTFKNYHSLLLFLKNALTRLVKMVVTFIGVFFAGRCQNASERFRSHIFSLVKTTFQITGKTIIWLSAVKICHHNRLKQNMLCYHLFNQCCIYMHLLICNTSKTENGRYICRRYFDLYFLEQFDKTRFDGVQWKESLSQFRHIQSKQCRWSHRLRCVLNSRLY